MAARGRSKSPGPRGKAKSPAGTPALPKTRSKAAAGVPPPVTLPEVTLKVYVILLYVLVGFAANYEQGRKYEMYLANHVSACAVGVAVLLDESTEYYKHATFVCVLVALTGQWYYYIVPHFSDVDAFTKHITAAWPDISMAWKAVHHMLKSIHEQTPASGVNGLILKHENISDFIVEQVKKHGV